RMLGQRMVRVRVTESPGLNVAGLAVSASSAVVALPWQPSQPSATMPLAWPRATAGQLRASAAADASAAAGQPTPGAERGGVATRGCRSGRGAARMCQQDA